METEGFPILLGNLLRYISKTGLKSDKYLCIIRNFTSNIIYEVWGHEIDALFTFVGCHGNHFPRFTGFKTARNPIIMTNVHNFGTV